MFILKFVTKVFLTSLDKHKNIKFYEIQND